MDAKTKTNLLRAFAGECQARMRYEMAAKVAGNSGLAILQDMLYFTANQEAYPCGCLQTGHTETASLPS